MTRAADASTWDRQARRYGAQERHEARALAAAVRVAAPRAGDTVVDLATGTGAVMRALAALVAPPARVVGVDRSPGMLAAGAGSWPAGWSTVRADARAVPLPDASADLVTCAYLLHLLDQPDRAAVLGEAHRLLRPGGRLVLVTVWADPRTVGGRLALAALGAAARGAPARLGGLAPLDPSPALARARFAVRRRVQLPRGGYPSLVLQADRR